MPKEYIRASYGRLNPQDHLQKVKSVDAAALQLACDKFNYVAQETVNKGKKPIERVQVGVTEGEFVYEFE